MHSHNDSDAAQLPTIIKYSSTAHNSVQVHTQARHGIGYILRGCKNVYNADTFTRISVGELFYLGIGSHYTQDVPDEKGVFEQIMFYYTRDELQQILLNLSIAYKLNITNYETDNKLSNKLFVIFEKNPTLSNFFILTNNYIKSENFNIQSNIENIKLTELICHIINENNSVVKSIILDCLDADKQHFKHIVYSYIFEDVSLMELATITNRSLTSFKKTFIKNFDMPPHKWYIRQRLKHSKLLLISTSKSISEIGAECTFPNTSHYIKLFKREFNETPANFRVHFTSPNNTKRKVVNL